MPTILNPIPYNVQKGLNALKAYLYIKISYKKLENNLLTITWNINLLSDLRDKWKSGTKYSRSEIYDQRE